LFPIPVPAGTAYCVSSAFLIFIVEGTESKGQIEDQTQEHWSEMPDRGS